MNSKEALEQLRDKAQLLALFMGKDAGDHLVNVDTLYNTIKQDLERLEALEKENIELKKFETDYHIALAFCEASKEEKQELAKENQQLLVNKNVAQALAIKYKKAIEIIKKIVSIPLEDDFAKVNIDKVTKEETHYYALSIKYLIDEQEYELLKGVLSND
jgi:stress response protein YsnF